MSAPYIFGDRVRVDYAHPSEKKPRHTERFEGEIRGRARGVDQWRVRPDGEEKSVIVHERFITKIGEPERV